MLQETDMVCSELETIRDAILDRLASGRFVFVKVTNTFHWYGIRCNQRRGPAFVRPDRANQPVFVVWFAPDGVTVEMHRDTGVRKLANYSYEDPTLFGSLATLLAKLDIRLDLPDSK